MKKRLVVALVASFVLSLGSTALADPVEFTGDFRLQGRAIDNDVYGGDLKENYWQFRTRLNFAGQIDDKTSFFGRFSAVNRMGGDQYGKSSSGNFDQYGIKMVDNDWTFKVGRQTANLGQGTIISTGYNAAGLDNKFDGLTIGGTTGKIDVNLIGGKVNHEYNSDYSCEVYGLDLTSKLDDKFTLGAAFASTKYDVAAAEGRNLWAVNFTAKASDNLTFNGEYAKADTDFDNKAYFLNGTYSWDKDSFGVQYSRVERNSVDANFSALGAASLPYDGTGLGWANYYKGMTYTYTHQMTKNASFHLIYQDLKEKGDSGNDKELISGVVWKF